MDMQMLKGELVTFDVDRPGVRIRCRSGRVWVTQAGDSRDYLLAAGQQVALRRRGRVVITALEESRCFPETVAGNLPPLQVVHA